MKLDEIRALIDAATPGPWDVCFETGLNPFVCTYGEKSGNIIELWKRIVACGGTENFHDLEFIAASRTLMPKLLEYVQVIEEALKCDEEALVLPFHLVRRFDAARAALESDEREGTP